MPALSLNEDSFLSDLYNGKVQDTVRTKAASWVTHQVVECLWATVVGRKIDGIVITGSVWK